MQDKREEWIAERAYELWEQGGRPDGQDHEHWTQASGEWDARDNGSKQSLNGSPAWDDEDS